VVVSSLCPVSFSSPLTVVVAEVFDVAAAEANRRSSRNRVVADVAVGRPR